MTDEDIRRLLAHRSKQSMQPFNDSSWHTTLRITADFICRIDLLTRP
jgi:hypothetical protein